ncbi:MAG TPA: PLP-dependent aminotransferase family protein [Actinomycetales bacterium]|nr:PLP-dependent aminotransferase family protein [Actinomycetales bacterium]
MTTRRIGPRELTRLLGSWPASGQPAYVALAARVRLLVLDGRLAVGVRLPPERELATALGISRTTVSAAYDLLRTSGHAASRQGSGTWTALPATGAEVPTWAPEPAPAGVLDLAHAAPPAPPQLHAAYTAALDDLPRELPGPGYDYRGLPALRRRLAERFTARGLPTSAEQVLVTSGALQAVRLAMLATVQPGDRVLVEQPGYPNALDVVTDLGARLVPVPMADDGSGRPAWDVPGLEAAVRQTAPRAAYLIPDFQNPTGALMPPDDRDRVATMLRRARTVAVVDETLVELGLDTDAGRPFAAFADGPIVTVGSASKVFWGGLRVGWLRADASTVARLAALRSRQDLSSPVLEQLACVHLMDDLDEVRTHRVEQLRSQRDGLVALVRHHLPDWRFTVPTGGQVLWCALPGPWAAAVCDAAAERGVRLTAGSRFAADGTLESSLRLPYTRPLDELAAVVPLLADAWAQVQSAAGGPTSGIARADPYVV